MRCKKHPDTKMVPDRDQGYICPACYDEAGQKAEARKRFQERFRGAQIGRRYQHCTFDNYDIGPGGRAAQHAHMRCLKYANRADQALERGTSLILAGTPGTGKNHLAAAICRAFAERGYQPLHTTALKLVRKIKSSWGADAEMSEQKAIEMFSEPDLLVIDEIGQQYGSATEKLLLTEVINERYENFRPTILLTNLTAEQLKATLGERVIDRFREGEIIVMNWESYRTKKHTKEIENNESKAA